MLLGNLFATLKADFHANTERGRLSRSTVATAGMKIGATFIAFLASLLYARALGPHGFGLYSYVIAWAALLTIPAGLGLPQYLVREGAKTPLSQQWLLRWADHKIIVAGVLTALLMVGAVLLPAVAGARWLFVIAAPIPLLSNLASVRSALLQAHGRIVSSQWPQLLIAPLVMLILLTALWLWRSELHPMELVATMTACGLLPLAINHIQFHRVTPITCANELATARLHYALPFMLLGGLYILNNRVDLIMLGTLKGAQEVGIYAIASRIAMLTPFVGEAANIALAPRVAQLYHTGNMALLQRMMQGAAWRYTLVSALIATFLIWTAPTLIRYLYGAEYANAVSPLQVLIAGYLFRVIFGSAGTVLMMSGRERAVAYNLALAVAINITLNIILIPRYGTLGASSATAVSLVGSQLLLWHHVRKHMNISTDAISALIWHPKHY